MKPGRSDWNGESAQMPALQEVFGAMRHCRVAPETGTHSPWISRLLHGWGHEVIVANARRVRLIGFNEASEELT
jgi:transposase